MRKFSELRIAVAMAPQASFEGHDYAIATAALSSLAELGPQIQAIQWFDWADQTKRRETIARIKDFAPHFATSFPNAGYGILMQDGSPGADDADNLFTDILRVPLALNWDHIIPQGPNYFLGARLYEDPPQSGAIRVLRHKFGNSLLRHYSPDSGHIAVLEGYGVLAPRRASVYAPGARDHFVAGGRTAAAPTALGRVGFTGNIYAARGSRLPILQHPVIRQIDEAMLAAKRANWEIPGWTILLDAIAQIPDAAKTQLGLDPDFPFFWLAALDLLSERVLTAFRLSVLAAIRQPVDFFGNFADPESSQALAEFDHITYCGNADFFTELPEIYRSREIWVDATNAPFINGCGAKAIDCFAAGSMMLVDHRRDLRDNVGDLADRFMYRTADELREKIEYYLARPKERLEVVEAMQTVIRERLTYRHHYERMCADMEAEVKAAGAT